MKNEMYAVLASRNDYGSFPAKAAWLQGIKASMRCADSWDKLAPAEQEALDAIAGYATLALGTYHDE